MLLFFPLPFGTDFCHIVGLAFESFFVVVAVLVAYHLVFLFVAASSF